MLVLEESWGAVREMSLSERLKCREGVLKMPANRRKRSMQGHRGYVTQVTETVRDTGKLMAARVWLLFDFHPRCKMVL